jgi:DNA-binding GntR family transcriptional regulator
MTNPIESPRDRLMFARERGTIYRTQHGHARIVSAELVPLPPLVAAVMSDIEDAGKLVIRRERVTYEDDRPVQLSVSWMPAELAEAVPALLAA